MSKIINEIKNDTNVQLFLEWFKEFFCKLLNCSTEEYDKYFSKHKEALMNCVNVDKAFTQLAEGLITDWTTDHLTWCSRYKAQMEQAKICFMIMLNYIAKDMSELEFAVHFNFFDWVSFAKRDREVDRFVSDEVEKAGKDYKDEYEFKEKLIKSKNWYTPETIYRFFQYAVEGTDTGSEFVYTYWRYLEDYKAIPFVVNFVNSICQGLTHGAKIYVDLHSKNYYNRLLAVKTDYYGDIEKLKDQVRLLNQCASELGIDKRFCYAF